MRHAFVLLILLTGSMIVFSAPGLTPDPENLPNLQEPRLDIYTAGQPTETGFREAASMGVRTVINVLPDEECWTDEGEFVSGQKMVYITLPFQTTGFKMETIRRFSHLLENAQKPLLIHCRTGNHVGGLWFAHRVLVERARMATALEEARMIGLQPELEANLVSWVDQQRTR